MCEQGAFHAGGIWPKFNLSIVRMAGKRERERDRARESERERRAVPAEIPLAVLQCRGLTVSQKAGKHIKELAFA